MIVRLKKKHKPNDEISAVDLNTRLSRLKIKARSHPDKPFDKRAEINIPYGFPTGSSWEKIVK